MLRTRLIRTAAALLATAAALSACSSAGPGTTAPEPSTPGPTTANTDSPIPSATTLPSHSEPKPRFTERTTAQLRTALLRTADLPAGYDKAKSSTGGDIEVGSADAACQALVSLVQADHPERAVASASVSYTAGNGGVDETLSAMGTTGRATDLIERVRRAPRGCASLTLSAKGGASSPLTVSEVTDAGAVGDSNVVLQFAADRGSFAGVKIFQVYAHRGDVVLGLTVVGGSATGAHTIAVGALDRAATELSLPV